MVRLAKSRSGGMAAKQLVRSGSSTEAEKSSCVWHGAPHQPPNDPPEKRWLAGRFPVDSSLSLLLHTFCCQPGRELRRDGGGPRGLGSVVDTPAKKATPVPALAAGQN